MSEYIKKLKEAVRTPSIPTTQITESKIYLTMAEYSRLIDTVRGLESRLKTMEQWKDSDAIPQIKKLFSDIDKTKIDLTNYVDSVVASGKADIRNYVDSLMVTTKTEIEKYVDSLIETIKGTANEAIAKATGLVNVMKSAATQLKADASGIYNAAIVFRDTITKERRNISNGINAFSQRIRNAANVVKNHAVSVATQMSQAVSEISTPLRYTKNRLDLLYRDRYNLVAVAVNAYYAIAHLTFYNAGGQQGALEEVMEAFRQIGGAFTGLGTAFQSLGSETLAAGYALRNVINGSMARIGEAMRVFANSFQVLGKNLANVFDTAT